MTTEKYKKTLSDVFWLYFFVPAFFLIFIEIPIFWAVAAVVNYFSIAAFLILLLKAPWYIWCIKSLSRITKESPRKSWGTVAILVVVIWVTINVVLSIATVTGLSSI